jgi:hypothetical protein
MRKNFYGWEKGGFKGFLTKKSIYAGVSKTHDPIYGSG